ncbi:MAG: coproporphyrinogen III oxidase, partial [Candidatus Eisenbacteria bacterium]|nr:coproporphyrinogen III oxidase [Candidatus Eisenbacteria bacterium]
MTPSPSSPEPPVGLYLHVPFCRFLCTYCAFAKEEYESSRADAWLLGIAREIEYRAQHTWSERPQLDTVFLGGGTPTALTLAQWEKLGELLHQGFHIPPDSEFTSEANPESFNAE